MSSPLIEPALADSDLGPPILAVVSSGASIRSAGRHSHARGQLLGAQEGLLSVETAAGRWVAPAIHAVWIPPGQTHELLVHGPFRGWSVYVAPSACAALARTPRVVRVVPLLREAVARAATWTEPALDERRGRLAAVVVDEIAAAPIEPFGLVLPRDPRLARIAQALVADPASRRRLEDWAAWAAIPPRTLSRRFSAETGFSLTEWRQRARLLRALERLAAGAPVTTVALEVGYDNVSAFIALFRRAFATTPARYLKSEPAARLRA